MRYQGGGVGLRKKRRRDGTASIAAFAATIATLRAVTYECGARSSPGEITVLDDYRRQRRAVTRASKDTLRSERRGS